MEAGRGSASKLVGGGASRPGSGGRPLRVWRKGDNGAGQWQLDGWWAAAVAWRAAGRGGGASMKIFEVP
jgi:hypothetical protein